MAALGPEVADRIRRKAEAAPSGPVPVHRALKEHKRLVLLGEPGAGKTTTLRFLARCFADRHNTLVRDRLELDEERVPIFLPLQAYEGSEVLGEALARQVARASLFAPEDESRSLAIARELVQGWRESGRLILLLDGLDEVPSNRQGAVQQEIQKYAGLPEMRDCRVIVSSRHAGYAPLGSEWAPYEIKPFAGGKEARPFVEAWLRALGRPDPPGEAAALLAAMERQPGLKRVMGNALVLRMAAELYAATPEHVVAGRADLYDRYLNYCWDRAQRRCAQNRWDKQASREALRAVAWELQKTGRAGERRLAERIAQEPPGVRPSDEWLDWVWRHMGLLATVETAPSGERVLAFAHATFREYPVAERLKAAWRRNRKAAWRFLRRRLHAPAWREPILLLADALGRDSEAEAAALARRILHAGSRREALLHRDLFLAAEAIAAGAEAGKRMRQEIVRRLAAFLKRARYPTVAGPPQKPWANWATPPPHPTSPPRSRMKTYSSAGPPHGPWSASRRGGTARRPSPGTATSSPSGWYLPTTRVSVETRRMRFGAGLPPWKRGGPTWKPRRARTRSRRGRPLPPGSPGRRARWLRSSYSSPRRCSRSGWRKKRKALAR